MLPVFLWILTSGENYFSVSISFQTPAANAPPANGPRIKIQICSKAAPPSKSAGPMLQDQGDRSLIFWGQVIDFFLQKVCEFP